MSLRALPRLAGLAAQRLVGYGGALWVLVVAGLGFPLWRLGSWLRRRRGARPRIVWGPLPMISIKYWSRALSAAGFESTTIVSGFYPIHRREDYDHYRDELLGKGRFSEALRDYAMFLWALRRADVLMFFFDGGYLAGTPLRRLELPLLRLAGRGIVVSPYGGDVAVPGHLNGAEAETLAQYPSIAESADRTIERVDHFSRWADVAIRNVQHGYQPRFDLVWPTQVTIDTEAWTQGERTGAANELVVVHSPNHRQIKGTGFLIEAVEELRGEGVPVRLELLEGRPNEEVREIVAGADVLAEQFLVGYGLSAIEGMAAGKVVLSNVSAIAPEVRDRPEMRECPIVDTNPATIADRLRELQADPALRADLGKRGREFAERHHSYAAAARLWGRIADHAWRGSGLPAELLPDEAQRKSSVPGLPSSSPE